MFLQQSNSLMATPHQGAASNDLQDLFMCESYFDEYTTTGSALDPSSASPAVAANGSSSASSGALQQQLQQQLHQQQLLQQFSLQQQQHPQQQQQQTGSSFELQLQSFLASNAVQQQQLQQQQLQLQLQHEQQQLLLNTQTQLAAFRWALVNSGINANPGANSSNIKNAPVDSMSPSDTSAFFSSPDLMASSLSPESDTLMLPTSPSAFSSSEDGALLSPLLLSNQAISSSPSSPAAATATIITANKTSMVDKAHRLGKRQSLDDGADAEMKSTTPASSTKRSKKATTPKATTGTAAPPAKKSRSKKASKTGSDQSDQEMTAVSPTTSATLASASTTPSPQTSTLPLPISLASSAVISSTAGDISAATSTAGFFQPLQLMPMTPGTSMAQPASPAATPFGQPLWKLSPGMVLPPTVPIGSTGFDPASFAAAAAAAVAGGTAPIMPTLDSVSTTGAPVTTPAPTTSLGQPHPHSHVQSQPQLLQQKIPITRLKPPQALVTPPPAPANSQLNQPTKQQKKVAHNAIERRYRNNINDRINDLKNVVPALCNIKAKDGSKDDNDDEDEDSPDEADGVARATKLNKATILRKATEYIIVLQKREQAVKTENTILRQLITSLPGGIELLEQHQAELTSQTRETSPSNLSGAEDSNDAEPATPPVTSGGGASRVLMAVFMCATFFSSPEGYSGSRTGAGYMDDGQGAGRAMSSSHMPSTVLRGPVGAAKASAGLERDGFLSGAIAWDTWAALRTLLFMVCLVALVWPSYSRRGPFVQSKFPAFPRSSTRRQVYETLSGLVPKVIPSSYFRLFFALTFELWRCLLIRLGIYPDLTDLTRPDIWARTVEVQLSGGAAPGEVSRFMLLYTTVRTLDEYTNARRAPPARVSATAAVAFYIALRKAAKPLATLVAQQFMDSARYTAKVFGATSNLQGHQQSEDQWLESMLKVEVGSAVWMKSIIEIESCMYGRGAIEYPQTDAVLRETMAPTIVVAQAQSTGLLQDAYIACISRLNSLTSTGAGNAGRFDHAVRTTLPGTRQHWYALVGKIAELWLLGEDEAQAQKGDQMMGQIMAMHPRHHQYQSTATREHRIGSEAADEELEAEFQYYDQVIVYSLLEYAYLRRGLAAAAVRCSEKAWVLLSERRRLYQSKPSPLSAALTTAGAMEQDMDMALLGVAHFAVNFVGFVEIKARIGLWRGVEVLGGMIHSGKENAVEDTNVDADVEKAIVSQAEILDHIRTTLMPLSVHLRRQLDDDSMTAVLTMMHQQRSTASASNRRTTMSGTMLTDKVDFDPALGFLIEIWRIAFGAWDEDGSEGSDSGCGSEPEENDGDDEAEEEANRNTFWAKSAKKPIATRKSDAEKAWELCLKL